MSRRRRTRLRPRQRVLAIALPTIFLSVAFLYIGFKAPDGLPGISYKTVRVELSDGASVTPHTQVRAAGVLVGQVLNPRVEGGRAVVDLQLTPGKVNLRSDAHLRVRPRSAVGSPYIELFPGVGPRALPAGQPIPAARTSAAVPLDDVLSTFDEGTRRRTQALMSTLGTGVAGRGDDIAQTLGATPQLTRDVRRALQPFVRQADALPRLIAGAAVTLNGFVPARELIPGGFRNGAVTLEAIDQRRQLQQTLADGGSALSSLRTGLRSTDPLLAGVRRLSTTALPVLRKLPGSLSETYGFLRSATHNVAPLRLTLLRARDAVQPTLALLRSTTRIGPALTTALSSLRPIVDELAPRRCDMLALTRNWSSMMSNGTPDGNVLRLALVTAGFNSVEGFTSPGGVAEPGVKRDPYPAPCQATTTDGSNPDTQRGR